MSKLNIEIEPIEIEINIPKWTENEALRIGEYVVKICYIEKPKGERVIHKGEIVKILSLEDKTTQIFNIEQEDIPL